MRVFVIGTGRCGTCTFYQACRHLTNYTVGHESKSLGKVKDGWTFPDNHIEVASNLIIGLPFLLSDYPGATWVWMSRNKEKCLESLYREARYGMQSFVKQWWYFSSTDPSEEELRAGVEQYYDWYQEICERILPFEQTVPFQLEHAADEWENVIKVIGAEGNLDASREEWERAYNSGRLRGRDNSVPIANQYTPTSIDS